MAIILIFAGVLIGFMVSSVFHQNKSVGVLRIDDSDSDGPYLFLEMIKDLEDVASRKTVVLTVKRKNFISHK